MLSLYVEFVEEMQLGVMACGRMVRGVREEDLLFPAVSHQVDLESAPSKACVTIGAPSILGAMPCFLLAFGSGGDSGDGDEEDDASRAFSEVSRDLFVISIFVRDLCLSRLKLLYPLYALRTCLYVYSVLYVFLTQ